MRNPFQWISNILGFETAQATVPVMDGALKPNRALDDAKVLLTMPRVANVLHYEGHLIFSSDERVYRWDMVNSPSELAGIPGDGAVCSIAINSLGLMAIGRNGDGVYLYDLGTSNANVQRIEGDAIKGRLCCVTALMFSSDERLLIANGSAINAAADWKVDLVSGGSSGTLLEYSVKEKQIRMLAESLAYPNGLAVDSKGDILVSEAWQHRVIRVSATGKVKVTSAISELPGYPAGLVIDRNGILRLSLFAPRSQLFEFIMREKPYLKRMVEETPQSNWVCPTLRSGVGYREPLQGGAVRQMGVHKAWAPTLSYGLVVEFDAGFHAIRSWHSRADGHAHGTTAVRCVGDKLIVAATGDGKLLELSAV